MGQDLLKVPQRSKELSSFSGPCPFILWGPQELINGHKPSMHPHCLGLQKPESQSEARNRDPLDRAEEVLEEDGGAHGEILWQRNHSKRHTDSVNQDGCRESPHP